MGAFLSGAISMGFLIAALLFLKFWRRTRDGLFLAFSISFALLGLQQTLLAISRVPLEEASPLYLIRLTAFVIIAVAIVLSNTRRVKR